MTAPVGPPAQSALQDTLGALLDVLGMLAIAAGVAWGLWRWLGPFSLAVAGLVLIMLSAIADAMRNAPAPPTPAVVPTVNRGHGPESPGTVHVSGR